MSSSNQTECIKWIFCSGNSPICKAGKHVQYMYYSISTVSTLHSQYTNCCTNELGKAQMNMGPNIEHK